MASINFGPFSGDNWFKKSPNPFQPIHLLSIAVSLNPFKPSKNPNFFTSISSSIPSGKSKAKPKPKAKPKAKPKYEPDEPGKYSEMLEQFFWECDNIPDHRHTPEVEKILTEDPIFEKKENPTPEEIEENNRFLEEFESSPLVKFLLRAEKISDEANRRKVEENLKPYRSEDEELWKAVGNVVGLDGRPMPRKAIKTDEESNDKFWDFFKQFLFGLWGFRQRPYPPSRPIDVAQAIGYQKLEKRYYDFIMRSGGFFYKDRLGHTRGPMELIQLKTAWGAGIIDKHTFVWGEDMDEWAPISMIYGMERAIATWEVRLGAAATALLHKLQKGMSPWAPLKGHEEKTYKQLKEEAIESKRRDLAVLEANDGVWPGVRTPSHALFLWASGTELSKMLEADHMPNKFVPKDIRLQLAEVFSGLRPWMVLDLERNMDLLVYRGKWYREPLGAFNTGPPYMQERTEEDLLYWRVIFPRMKKIWEKFSEEMPPSKAVFKKANQDALATAERRKQLWLEKKKAERQKEDEEAAARAAEELESRWKPTKSNDLGADADDRDDATKSNDLGADADDWDDATKSNDLGADADDRDDADADADADADDRNDDYPY